MLTKLAVLVVATAVLASCSGSTTGADTSTTVALPAPTATTSTSSPPTTTTLPPTTVPQESTTTTAAPNDALPGWDTWTLIYASLDTGTSEPDDAAAIAATIDGAEVLLSDDYPSLNPGYRVVYAGEWGSRREAGAWCPQSLNPALTCYPRYLGPSIPDLLAGGAALAQLDGGRLAALDLPGGEVLATFSDNFHWEAEFPSRFNLAGDRSALYFGMGWEDSWFSCDSDGGEVWRLDLDSGVEEVFSAGWSPAISPDGRWLAVVVAAECYPDPQQEGWVISPGSQIEVFDLADGDKEADHVLATATPPTSYDDPSAVLGVTWDPATGRDLLVTLADGSVRRIAFDSATELNSAELFWASEVGSLAAASMSNLYLVEWDGEMTAVDVYSRSSDALLRNYRLDGWVTGFARGKSGDVIITTSEGLILPDGERIPIEGGISNLAW